MNDELFESSDSVRSAEPLKYARSVDFDEPLELDQGGELSNVTVVYETYGRLNDDKSNAVLICHALSGDSHVARHDEADSPGWWDLAVGPGKAIDTDKYFVICPNILGGCRGTTGPNSINPDTNTPYGADFPTITIADMVELQRRLLDRLGIEKLLAVVGGSMGGHQVLHWAVRFAYRLRGAIVIATSARLSSQALAFDVVARNAILHDPDFRGGQYYDAKAAPNAGLAIARMLGHITYLSHEAMARKFEADRLQPREAPTEFEKKFSVGSYLAYQGAKFVERFDANSYLALSMAMDLFDLGKTGRELSKALADGRVRWLVMSFSSDWLFSPRESRQIVDALIKTDKPVSYCNVTSDCGHDAFLLPGDLESYDPLISGFLDNLSGGRAEAATVDEAGQDRSHTSIFHPEHPQRLDYDRILELIAPSASVLDLGCGDGELLGLLQHRGHERIMGVELDEKAVIACVQRGLDVVHADLNDGLAAFADKQFDTVVLSQTLQAVRDVEGVMDDMLRVGRQCIVSFPNFAYHKLRKMLYEQGKAPEAPGVLHYRWFDTPNIRFFSIADFHGFCRHRKITVHRSVALDTEARQEVTDDPNLNADLAIFVISR
ncbi:MAG: homoserine O-acetyltransferase [Planctomycetota bacterium]|nr:homoserine O-acetyltransferase [Planctomycetota bacterium]